MLNRFLFFLSWVLIAASSGCSSGNIAVGQTEAQLKAKPMNTSDLDRLFAARDDQAVEIARQGGPSMVPKLEPFLRNKDQEIRLLAVECLAAAGGTEAARLLIRTLSDSNEQVRANAVNALHTILPVGLEDALIAAWDSSNTRDGYVRQQIPMVLGRMKAQRRIGDLKRRLAADPRQDVRDGMVAGLAKLGDPDGRQMFGDMLRDARGKRTADVIEYVKYEDEPWVVPLLVPPLQRREIAIDLSSHRRQVKRRECDLAADEVMRISKARFSFAIDAAAQYSDAQINEVLRYAQAQPR
jgi:HEAT repeat protein